MADAARLLERAHSRLLWVIYIQVYALYVLWSVVILTLTHRYNVVRGHRTVCGYSMSCGCRETDSGVRTSAVRAVNGTDCSGVNRGDRSR